METLVSVRAMCHLNSMASTITSAATGAQSASGRTRRCQDAL
jgi:hypothetical protein